MADAATETDFGTEPEALLRERVQWLDPVRPVLDVGAGVGRNLIWLARQGFRGHAIEADPDVAARLEADAAGLPLAVYRCPFQVFEPVERYGAVLVFGLLPLLRRDDRDALLSLLPRWTVAGGLLFLTGFTDRLDPGRWPGELAPGEICELLPDAELLHHEEEIGPEHRHGDGPAHRHAWARAVLRL